MPTKTRVPKKHASKGPPIPDKQDHRQIKKEHREAIIEQPQHEY